MVLAWLWQRRGYCDASAMKVSIQSGTARAHLAERLLPKLLLKTHRYQKAFERTENAEQVEIQR